MNKKSFKVIFSLFAVLVAFGANSQNFPGFQRKSSGLFYKIYKTGSDTLTPRFGYYVTFDMLYHGKSNGRDSVFFNTKTGEHAAPVKMFLPPPVFSGDLNEGISMLAKGDSGVFIVNADSLIFRTFRMTSRPAGIDSNSWFYFHIYMLGFETQESLIFKEEAAINKYIADNKITSKPNTLGMYIIESKPGSGIKIDTGCMVKLNYKVSLLDGRELFSTYGRPEAVKFEFGRKIDTQGFDYGVSTLKKGSKATFIVPSLLAFGKRGSGSIVPPYTTLVYDVEIIDVKTKAESEQDQINMQKEEQKRSDSLKTAESVNLDKYLKDNKITTKPLPSGLYYISVLEGNGPKAENGKMVKVHYTGKLLNGKVFDSDHGKPLEFTLGRGQVIKGWEEGISMMKQGGKATFIIPSSIAYSDRDMGLIPPYSTLVFDIELVEVK